MNEPIASVKLGIGKENIAEYYDVMTPVKSRRAMRIFDVFFIVCGVLFTVCVIGYIAQGGYFDSSMKLYSAVVYYIVLSHFIKSAMARRRFVKQMTESLNKGINDSDHTDFYEDRLIVYKSQSRSEISYSDVTKLTESDTLVVISSKLGAHLFRRDKFYRGSFDDVKPRIIDLMNN